MVRIAAPSVLGVDRELALQFCGSIRHGQTVQLHSAKCTIGSGPRSTLRLRSRGVEPLHCLILQGASGTVIRRYGADARLNGRAFTDALLAPGDRLSIGPVEFEVLGAGRLADGLPTQAPKALDSRPTASPVDQREANELRARLSSATRQGRSRARRLIHELRSARQVISRLQQAEAEGVRDLERKAEQLARRQDEIEQRRGQWDDERAEAEKELQQRSGQLDQTAEQLSKRAKQVEQQSEQLDQRAERLDQRIEQFGVQTAEYDLRRAELDALQARLDSRERELDQRCRQMEEAGEEVEIEVSSTRTPTSGDEAFSRKRIAPPSVMEQGLEEEEESIDEYMARLLDRAGSARGGASEPEASPSSSATAPTVSPASTDSPPQSSPTAVEPGELMEPEEPRERTPRAAAAEGPVDLNAMRELANLSASAAIDDHAKKMRWGTATSSLLVAMVGLGAGSGLMWIWWAKAPNPLTLYGAAAGFVVALFWGRRSFLLGRRA